MTPMISLLAPFLWNCPMYHLFEVKSTLLRVPTLAATRASLLDHTALPAQAAVEEQEVHSGL